MKLKVDFYDGGYCTHPEFVAIKGGSYKKVKFAALCALITHPKHGKILYDTGYSENFYQATKKAPFQIYAKVTPVFVNNEDKVFTKLEQDKTADIKKVILSHFHADHIGGLRDFPEAEYIYTKSYLPQPSKAQGPACLGCYIRAVSSPADRQTLSAGNITISQDMQTILRTKRNIS